MAEKEQRSQTSLSGDSECGTAASVGSDSLYPLQRCENERWEAAIKIPEDDKLDEPAKIDAIGKIRCWFSGGTEILLAYLAGETDVVTAAARLADLIEQTYSTADHGRVRHREEMMARGQRRYHSPEIALEMWGAAQYFPEPAGDVNNPPSTELQLWELLYGMLHAARRIPWAGEARQNKLVNPVRAPKARPDPAQLFPMTISLKRNWIWVTGALWSDLAILDPSAWETWSAACGCGAGWTLPEQQA
ncbi:hypothetical protein DL768_004658 [Monosporascus sp. mg162]|nr:hypothetical protein DL768_004658 [Monosporascus sp. mg162]